MRNKGRNRKTNTGIELGKSEPSDLKYDRWTRRSAPVVLVQNLQPISVCLPIKPKQCRSQTPRHKVSLSLSLSFFSSITQLKQSFILFLMISTLYSVSKMKSNRKPPLAKSPMRLRPRQVLQPLNSCSLQTTPGPLTEPKKQIRCEDIEESELRPEYRTISCELRALTKMVREELGKANYENSAFANSCGLNSGKLFERGRFYDEYSARRNDRLSRKKRMTRDDSKAAVYNLGVAVESAKKSSSKKLESLRKSVSTTCSAEQREAPRYMLRSMTKGNKKLPPLPSNFEKSILGVEKKMGASRARRI